jgi:hypothetical protein
MFASSHNSDSDINTTDDSGIPAIMRMASPIFDFWDRVSLEFGTGIGLGTGITGEGAVIFNMRGVD